MSNDSTSSSTLSYDHQELNQEFKTLMLSKGYVLEEGEIVVCLIDMLVIANG
jgi:hypothetical protein